MVPQDVAGVATLMGGRDAAAARLDTLFHDAAGNWSVLGGDPLRYDPTNEPGIHAPWLHDGLGQPWKTQAAVRQIVDTAYGTGPAGRPGNDDLGTMSAWYVFAAMGIFPQVPGRAEMLLGSPVFTYVTLVRSNGVRLTINANSTDAYVQSVRLNGASRPQSWLPESFVQRGGTVGFTLGATASAWGSPPVDH
jgi:putative alpha-1,2-mannosidase